MLLVESFNLAAEVLLVVDELQEVIEVLDDDLRGRLLRRLDKPRVVVDQLCRRCELGNDTALDQRELVVCGVAQLNLEVRRGLVSVH